MVYRPKSSDVVGRRVFIASCGPRSFEHRFVIVFVLMLIELLDRPSGDNLFFTMDSLQKKNKDSQVPRLLRFVNEFPSTLDHCFNHSYTILASFLNIFSTSIWASMFVCIDFNRFGNKNGSPSPPLRHFIVPKGFQKPSTSN